MNVENVVFNEKNIYIYICIFFFIQNVALKRAAEALLPRGDTPPAERG